MSLGEAMRPTLVVNPADDGVFAAFSQIIVDHGALTIDELERGLRSVYPQAAVHERQLAAEPILIWYVYRDGHWVDTWQALQRRGVERTDARPATGPSSDRGIDPSRRGADEDIGGAEGTA